MSLLNKIIELNKADTVKCLNYPSKGLILFIILIIIWTSIFTIAVCIMFFNRWNGDIISKIYFIVIMIIVCLVFSLVGKVYVYKPIRFYEKKYGKTGLGDNLINK